MPVSNTDKKIRKSLRSLGFFPTSGKPCPAGKARNPATKRCKSTGKATSMTSKLKLTPRRGRSKSVTRSRSKSRSRSRSKSRSTRSKSLTPCRAGMIRNKKTNRCKTKPCPKGKYRNPLTHRCKTTVGRYRKTPEELAIKKEAISIVKEQLENEIEDTVEELETAKDNNDTEKAAELEASLREAESKKKELERREMHIASVFDDYYDGPVGIQEFHNQNVEPDRPVGKPEPTFFGNVEKDVPSVFDDDYDGPISPPYVAKPDRPVGEPEPSFFGNVEKDLPSVFDDDYDGPIGDYYVPDFSYVAKTGFVCTAPYNKNARQTRQHARNVENSCMQGPSDEGLIYTQSGKPDGGFAYNQDCTNECYNGSDTKVYDDYVLP